MIESLLPISEASDLQLILTIIKEVELPGKLMAASKADVFLNHRLTPLGVMLFEVPRTVPYMLVLVLLIIGLIRIKTWRDVISELIMKMAEELPLKGNIAIILCFLLALVFLFIIGFVGYMLSYTGQWVDFGHGPMIIFMMFLVPLFIVSLLSILLYLVSLFSGKSNSLVIWIFQDEGVFIITAILLVIGVFPFGLGVFCPQPTQLNLISAGGEVLKTYPTISPRLQILSMSPDGNYIAVQDYVGMNDLLVLRRLRDGKVLWSNGLPFISSVQWSPDGSTVIGNGHQRSCVGKMTKNSDEWIYPDDEQKWKVHFAWDRTGERLYRWGSENRKVSIVKPENLTGKAVDSFILPGEGEILDLRLVAEDKYLISYNRQNNDSYSQVLFRDPIREIVKTDSSVGMIGQYIWFDKNLVFYTVDNGLLKLKFDREPDGAIHSGKGNSLYFYDSDDINEYGKIDIYNWRVTR